MKVCRLVERLLAVGRALDLEALVDQVVVQDARDRHVVFHDQQPFGRCRCSGAKRAGSIAQFRAGRVKRFNDLAEELTRNNLIHVRVESRRARPI